jgi:repressor LexA
MRQSSDTRQRLLEAIAHHEMDDSFPSVREIAQELGFAGESSITRVLNKLEQEGLLRKHGGGREGVRRIYRLTPEGHLVRGHSVHGRSVNGGAVNRRQIPVLGAIAAGQLAEAIQECDEWIDPVEGLTHDGDFFLTVKGDSMIGDGILPGDLVLIRPSLHVASGQIAAVCVVQGNETHEATLKRFYYQPGQTTVRLKASNLAYADMVVSARDTIVIGTYKGVVRRVD